MSGDSKLTELEYVELLKPMATELSAMAIAPIAELGPLSNNDVQVWPASSVFHTPPPEAPKTKLSGLPGTPSIISAHPARNGPSSRQ